MDRFETLLTSYLEGSLNSAEHLELADFVRGEISCRKRFLVQTELNGLLWALNVPAIHETQLISRALSCLPGAAKANATVADVMDLVSTFPARKPAASSFPNEPKPENWKIPRRVFAAAVAALVLGAVVWLIVGGKMDPRNLAAVATLRSFTGRTELISPLTDEREIARTGQPMLSMRGLETTGSATIVFRDDTTFVLTGGEYVARIWLRNMQPGRVTHREAAFGKRVTVDLGSVHFSVTKQPENEPMIVITPHAEVQVVGTAFSVEVLPHETKVKVDQGEVQVTRIDDRSVITLKKDQSVSTLGDFSPSAKQ